MSHNNKKNMDKNIARARKFAHKSLKENLSGVSKGDYFIFQISKFLLLKESIIKKDCKNNSIYFNYEKNGKYLKVIQMMMNQLIMNAMEL